MNYDPFKTGGIGYDLARRGWEDITKYHKLSQIITNDPSNLWNSVCFMPLKSLAFHGWVVPKEEGTYVHDNATFFPVDGQGWQERHDLLMPWQVPTIERNSSTGWLVGGLEHFFIFPHIGKNHPNWLSYFSEGCSNHQPGLVCSRRNSWCQRWDFFMDFTDIFWIIYNPRLNFY